jgi:hypothetical protein
MLTQVPYSKGCLSQISTSVVVVVGFRTVLGDKIGYGDDSISSPPYSAGELCRWRAQLTGGEWVRFGRAEDGSWRRNKRCAVCVCLCVRAVLPTWSGRSPLS